MRTGRRPIKDTYFWHYFFPTISRKEPVKVEHAKGRLCEVLFSSYRRLGYEVSNFGKTIQIRESEVGVLLQGQHLYLEDRDDKKALDIYEEYLRAKEDKLLDQLKNIQTMKENLNIVEIEEID